MKDRPETPLDRQRSRRTEGDEADAKRAREEMAVDELHFAVFDTPRGKEWLQRTEEILLHRITNQEMSDGALRGLEHTRNFLRVIKSRVARHRERGGAGKE